VRLLDDDPHHGKLPYGIHDKVRNVRNVLEHWDEWTQDKLSAKEFRERFPGVWPYGTHMMEGDYMLAGVVSFLSLERALGDLYAWLKAQSPARIYPPPTEPIRPYPLER
jgi:hypothetical protein